MDVQELSATQQGQNRTNYIWGGKEERLRTTSVLASRGLQVNNTVKNLGVLIDYDLDFNAHMKAVTKSAFHHLKNTAKLRGLMSQKDLEKLIMLLSLVR